MALPKHFFGLFALLLCLSSLYAAQPPSFAPKYSWGLALSTQEGALPAESLVYVRYGADNGKEYSTILSLREGGRATLYTNTGVSWAEISYDDEKTPALDAVWNGSLESAEQQKIIRLPSVGEVAGVLSYQNGSAAAYVPVELSCSDGVERSAITGESGAFSFSRVRAGKCIASATADGIAVQEEFPLAMGQFVNLGLMPKKNDFTPIIAALGITALCALVLVMLLFKKPGEQGSQGEKRARMAKPKVEKMPTQRQLDLLSTLDEKEKSIVNYAIHHFPAAVRVSRIRRDLLIPKTSLTRTLAALERKQFLKVEKVGARQFAQLHEFFKGNALP